MKRNQQATGMKCPHRNKLNMGFTGAENVSPLEDIVTKTILQATS